MTGKTNKKLVGINGSIEMEKNVHFFRDFFLLLTPVFAAFFCGGSIDCWFCAKLLFGSWVDAGNILKCRVRLDFLVKISAHIMSGSFSCWQKNKT